MEGFTACLDRLASLPTAAACQAIARADLFLHAYTEPPWNISNNIQLTSLSLDSRNIYPENLDFLLRRGTSTLTLPSPGGSVFRMIWVRSNTRIPRYIAFCNPTLPRQLRNLSKLTGFDPFFITHPGKRSSAFPSRPCQSYARITRLNPAKPAFAPEQHGAVGAILSPDGPLLSIIMNDHKQTHLKQLEAESIHIIREVAAEFERPVMLYSIGKDSAVMLHLAMKAFYPGKPPFPLMHVDTNWKFRDMIAFRDQRASELGLNLIIHVNEEGIRQQINPFIHGSKKHTDIMKTEGLKQALDKYRFDAAFGGARRDEEKSRAKERVYSFRDQNHRWDPKNQRPELWQLYNGKINKGESIRVFPLSNWTELDIWQYIYLENIPIVPLYYAQERPVVERDGMLIMVDDERMPLLPGEVVQMRKVRFRTLGCYPLTGAVDSEASTLPEIIQEMLLTKTSERQGRLIDHDSAGSMEEKKKEGYF